MIQKQRYISRISGPLLDRIDLHVEMPEVAYDDIASKAVGETSAEIKRRVDKARQVQRERYKGDGILFNAQLSNKLIKKYCEPDTEGAALLAQAFTALELSARAYMRILKVARTIADLAGMERIGTEHISEAIQYRTLDRKYWGS
jgi:magnesium chelatase family protein